MDVGINVATTTDSWQIAQRAEQLGFHSVWFWDIPMLTADVFSCMALAAANTSRIRLATGVYVPSLRSPTVTACALATLNKMAPGRIDFAAGTGFTARRVIGHPPVSRKAFYDHVVTVQKLLTGETTEIELEGKRTKTRFIQADKELINILDPIKLHIAAGGPKMREMVAQFGAGYVNALGAFGFSASEQLTAMRGNWIAAGRDPSDLYSTFFHTGACLLRRGETLDSPRVRAIAGPFAAVSMHVFVEALAEGQGTALGLPPHILDGLKKYSALCATYLPQEEKHLSLHRGHAMFLRPDEETIITGEIIRDLTLTGTAEALEPVIADQVKAGVSQIVIPLAHGHEDAMEDWADFLDLKRAPTR